MIKFNQKAILLAALICGTLGFSAACGGGAATTNSNSGNSNVVVTNTKPANTTEAPKTGDVTKNDTPASSGEKTGVAECDEYVEKYEICLMSIANKYPQAHPGMKTAFDAQRKALKDGASTPQGKTMLASQCKQMMDTAKQATTAYACKW